MDEWGILHKITKEYLKILKTNLVGIYVHGSIAFECFHWWTSDIDFLVVTNQEPCLQEKERLIRVLLDLDLQSPPKGIEMSVVLKSNCQKFIYPTPYQLHYSNAHKNQCKANCTQYCKNMHGSDIDLAAHFTIVREKGITLYGEDKIKVFNTVPKQYFLESIQQDVKDAVVEIEKNPIYTILNLCRVWAYVSEGVILSKEEGGVWGIANLPLELHAPIEAAQMAYSKNIKFKIHGESLKIFAKSMLVKIFHT